MDDRLYVGFRYASFMDTEGFLIFRITFNLHPLFQLGPASTLLAPSSALGLLAVCKHCNRTPARKAWAAGGYKYEATRTVI